jgi:hypothetical protein
MSHNLWVLMLRWLVWEYIQPCWLVKYAYLPQHLQTDELVGGNGLIEMGTLWYFAGRSWAHAGYATMGVELVAAGAVIVAVIGCLTSRRIPYSPARNRN